METRGFWRLGAVVCVCLLLVSVSLGAVALTRAPRLASVTFDAARSVTRAGEQLVWTSREPVVAVGPSQIHVTPAAPFTVTTSGSVVTVQFSGPLAYATSYEVSVTDIRTRYPGRPAQWQYAFTTPAAHLFALRTESGTSQVLEVAGSQQTPVLTATGVTDYTVAGDAVVAVSHPGDGTARLVAARRDGTSLTVGGPQAKTLGQLQASTDGSRVGYVADGALLVSTTADLGAAPVTITNAGAALAVKAWAFVPGVNAVVTLTTQGTAYLTYLDSAGDPSALGTFSDLLGFLPGTTNVALRTTKSDVVLFLSTGTTSAIAATPDRADNDFAGRRVMVTPYVFLQEFNRVDDSASGSAVTTTVAKVADGTVSNLTQIAPGAGQLVSLGVSPNGQYGWGVVIDADAPDGDYAADAPTHATTLVFDLATGATVASIRGSQPVWA